MGSAACNSGSAKSPPAAPSSKACTDSASSLESGILPPAQAGTTPRDFFATRTSAAISCVRTNSSTRPANTKQSPLFSRAMKPSSTWPSVAPAPATLAHFTAIDASETMVPTISLWRRAMPGSATRQRPSSCRLMRWYSG